MPGSYLTHLECSSCAAHYPADRLWNLCPACGRPLLARYDLAAARAAMDRDDTGSRARNVWRFHELQPVADPGRRLTLGEGGTPLLRAARLGAALEHNALYIKDESGNPTTSFKARGMALAVACARERGVRELSVPSAGNAAGALSAYAAAAGLAAHVFMPRDVPVAFVTECDVLGASVELVDGLITDCGRRAQARAAEHGWFDLSTLKEPYRLEGKKTLGYELAEQFGWALPDVVIYPTGGGTGLVGMWKAFDELEELGWIDARRPRMVSVQSTGCAPIVRAFTAGADHAEPWEDARTVADGLRVPAAVGDLLMLEALRDSGGTAVAVADEEMIEGAVAMARSEGVFAAPEGGATVAALRRLTAGGYVRPDETVVLFNTGSGHKYSHLWQK
jgi:threonine synthase